MIIDHFLFGKDASYHHLEKNAIEEEKICISYDGEDIKDECIRD